MKRFLILHYGFEKPSEADMARWMQWFEALGDQQLERGHLPAGKEISSAGTKDLPFGRDSITGYTLIQADDLDAAEEIAAGCPFVDATRVYEIMTH